MTDVEFCERVQPITITLTLPDFTRNLISTSIIGGLDDKIAKAASKHKERGITASLSLTL
jgi:hypothetical protein